jgi:hypothetical protein
MRQVNPNSPWIADAPEDFLKESLFIFTRRTAARDLHIVAGYGYRNFSVRDPERKAFARRELNLTREVQTYCSRWTAASGVHTWEDMQRTKFKPETHNICHQCLRRLPDRILDYNDALLFDTFESIGHVLLYDVDPTDNDMHLEGLKRAVRLRQI